MKIITLTLGALQSHSYIIASDKNNAVAVDIGAEAESFMQCLDENGLTLKKIILTHGHFDHIGAVAEIQRITNAEVYIHTKDAPMMTDGKACLADFVGGLFHPIEEFTEIFDGTVITVDELNFKTISTPGHTQGSVCYICGDAMFSGDTLFYQSIGRTDLPGGSFFTMSKTLAMLKNLDGDYTVYPGHGDLTTLDFERKNNPYMKDDINDYTF